MASRRKPAQAGAAPAQGELVLAPAAPATPTPAALPDLAQVEALAAQVEALAAQLAAAVAALPLAAQVEALNLARTALHEVSPFKSEPVDLVLWVPGETVGGNEWNPNTVFPPEMRLLQHSIEADGYTQPIVAHRIDDIEEIVDGFHRNRCGREVPAIRARVHGYLPITRINANRAAREDRIAATIRHNRARGEHGVDRMSDIVRMLTVLGWTPEQIGAELGMQEDEVLRLKQITGLAALFVDREFTRAWESSA